MDSEKNREPLRSPCCNAIVSWGWGNDGKLPPTCHKCGRTITKEKRRAEDGYQPGDDDMAQEAA